jgi:hypothetical protein
MRLNAGRGIISSCGKDTSSRSLEIAQRLLHVSQEHTQGLTLAHSYYDPKQPTIDSSR